MIFKTSTCLIMFDPPCAALPATTKLRWSRPGPSLSAEARCVVAWLAHAVVFACQHYLPGWWLGAPACVLHVAYSSNYGMAAVLVEANGLDVVNLGGEWKQSDCVIQLSGVPTHTEQKFPHLAHSLVHWTTASWPTIRLSLVLVH